MTLCSYCTVLKQRLGYNMDVFMSGSGCGDDDSWTLAQQ